jgi:diguanylate cyclase (GGDEF)-like protein
MYAAGAACVAVAAWLAVRDGPPDAWRLAVAVAALAIGHLRLLQLRVGHELEFFNLGETATVIGLAILPAPWLVLIAPAISGLVYLVQGTVAQKAGYNASLVAVGFATTGTLVALAGGVTSHPSALVVATVAAAAILNSFWTLLAVAGAVSLSTGVALRDKVRQVSSMSVLTAVGNTTLGLAILAIGRWSPFTLLILPPVLLALWLAYRASHRSIQQRDAWRQLNEAAEQLAELDERMIAEQAEARARQLFSLPDDVELILRPEAAAELTPPDARLRRIDQVAMALTSPNGPIGLLRLRFAKPVAWPDHENQVLAAFAHTVSSALSNARLYAEARRQAEEQAREAAHDSLTGLGNRRMLMDRAGSALAKAAATGGVLGLLLIDLDKFKEVNDSLGHTAGDRLLCGVADRLRRSVRSDDIVARLGGDEFAVLITGIGESAQAESAAHDLADMLARRPVEIDGITLPVEGSIGIACFPDDATTMEELLKRADVAMYQAKKSSARCQRYRADRDDSTFDRLALVADLPSALDNGELLLYYQPQLELRTGRVTSVEALVRWEHPVRGRLQPEKFVPAIEQSGFVREFTGTVLEQALTACAAWRAGGLDVGVSVNLSARNVADTDLPSEVARLLLRHRVPAGALTLELTETAMMADITTAEGILAELNSLGVRLAVDDFGTGYSSLTLLQRCTLHEVKIDRGFVAPLLVERNNAAIVQATIGLAHTLDLKVVAEGVESREIMDALATLGCDHAQGSYIGGPMPVATLTPWLRARETIAVPPAVGQVLPLRPRRPPHQPA